MSALTLCLSPHFDDAAYSCGGWVYQHTLAGQTLQVLTVCAGEPTGPLSPFAESLHTRWGTTATTTVSARRAEDETAMRWLGVAAHYLTVPDCIYRQAAGQALYASEAALFGPVHPADETTLAYIVQTLQAQRPSRVVAPLGIGGHVDHQLTRQAAEAWGGPLWYYEDCPYAMRAQPHPRDGWGALTTGLRPVVILLSPQALAAHSAASAAYASQLNTFWESTAAMRQAFEVFFSQGMRLWVKKI